MIGDCDEKIYEDLGVPFFADHIRVLTDSLDTTLAHAGNPFVRKFGRLLSKTFVCPVVVLKKPPRIPVSVS
jgi:hypothetical protein